MSLCVNASGLQCGAEVISSQPLATAALVVIPLLGIMLVGLLQGSISKVRFWLLWMSLVVFEGLGLLVYFMLAAK